MKSGIIYDNYFQEEYDKAEKEGKLDEIKKSSRIIDDSIEQLKKDIAEKTKRLIYLEKERERIFNICYPPPGMYVHIAKPDEPVPQWIPPNDLGGN